MKLKAYHSIIIFAVLTMSAIFSSVSNYRKAQYAIVKDMDRALALTIQKRQDQWITPDTIQSYRSHLNHYLLRQTSILCYAEEKERNGQLTSRSMLLDKNHVQGYACCSMLDVLGMSDQRTPLSLSLLAMLWATGSVVYLRKKKEEELALALECPLNTVQTILEKSQAPERESFGTLSYSSSDDTFYHKETDTPIRFTPMQHQLMQLFLTSRRHQLSKQEICEALWPKKPDASETLYTLIRRLKPIVEGNCNLMIESERGRAYRLVEKEFNNTDVAEPQKGEQQ